MFLKTSSLWLCAIAAVYALPASVPHPYSDYTVKERHIVPRGWVEVGPASKSHGIHLQIGLKQRNEGVIEQHLLEISDPSHARYGQHLLPGEIHDIVRPSDECVQLVHAWLLEHGITDAVYSPANDWVSVFVSIGKAEELLQTEYKIFKHEEDGDVAVRAPVWSLPEYLHEHIDVVQPTTSFFRTAKKNTIDNIRQQGEEEDEDSVEDVDLEKRQVCHPSTQPILPSLAMYRY